MPNDAAFFLGLWPGKPQARLQVSGLTIPCNAWANNDLMVPNRFSDGSKPNERPAFRAWFGGG